MCVKLDRVIDQFKNLSKSGLDAHIDAHAHAGQAWVSLHVRLGHVNAEDPGKGVHEKVLTKNRNSPSRQRRRICRAAEREAALSNEKSESDDDEDVDKSFKPNDTTEKSVDNALGLDLLVQDDHPVSSENFEEMKNVKINYIKNESDLKLMEIKSTKKVATENTNDEKISEVDNSTCKKDKQTIIVKALNEVSQNEFFSVMDGIMEDIKKNMFKPP